VTLEQLIAAYEGLTECPADMDDLEEILSLEQKLREAGMEI
jgi:hypothetical protein